MDDIGIIGRLYNFVVNGKGPEGFASQCDEKTLPPVKYHECVLEENLQIHEDFRRKSKARDLEQIPIALRMIDNKTPFTTDSKQAAKELIYSLAAKANPQASNWVRLSAAKLSIYYAGLVYDRYKDKVMREKYWEIAHDYLQEALANKNTNIGYDISWKSISNPWQAPIYYVEGYFELQLTLFQFYTLYKPKEALTLGTKLEKELRDEAFLRAQGSNLVSAEGYLHRLRLLRGTQTFYQQGYNLWQAIGEAQESQRWAKEKHAMSGFYLWTKGMNKKDLKHDTIMSRVLEAKLLIKANQFEKAKTILQGVMKNPYATRKYGGFGNLGVEALALLFYIALLDSNSKPQAAAKFHQMVDWHHLNEQKDFKEMLGLLLRGKNFWYYAEWVLGAKISSGWDSLGELSLWFDSPKLAPENKGPIESEVDLTKITNKVKLFDQIMRSLRMADIEPRLRNKIIKHWEAL